MQEYNLEDFIVDEKRKKNDELRHKLFLVGNIIIYVLIFFFAVFLCWYIYFKISHEYYSIEGASMVPTINENYSDEDGVYINKWSKGKINDIVILNIEQKSKPIIKRYIAGEGDLVSIKISPTDHYYHLYRINKNTDLEKIENEEDYRVDENYINSYVDWTRTVSAKSEKTSSGLTVTYEKRFYDTFIASGNYETWQSANGINFVYIPKDEFFFMGDNRANSYDARECGTSKVADIKGKVDIIIKDVNTKDRFWSVFGHYYKNLENYFSR